MVHLDLGRTKIYIARVSELPTQSFRILPTQSGCYYHLEAIASVLKKEWMEETRAEIYVSDRGVEFQGQTH